MLRPDRSHDYPWRRYRSDEGGGRNRQVRRSPWGLQIQRKRARSSSTSRSRGDGEELNYLSRVSLRLPCFATEPRAARSPAEDRLGFDGRWSGCPDSYRGPKPRYRAPLHHGISILLPNCTYHIVNIGDPNDARWRDAPIPIVKVVGVLSQPTIASDTRQTKPSSVARATANRCG